MKTCLNCREAFSGRRDKKFCSDYCRSEHHNRANQPLMEVLRATNARLKRNYSILKKFAEKQQYTPTKSQLTANGYHFDYFTGIIFNEDRPTYCLYDLQFIPLGDHTIQITVNQQTHPL